MMNSFFRKHSTQHSAFLATTIVAGSFLYEYYLSVCSAPTDSSKYSSDTQQQQPSSWWQWRPRYTTSSSSAVVPPPVLCETPSQEATAHFTKGHNVPSSSSSSSSLSSSSSSSSSKPGTKLLFLGSGSSTGCPKPICALLFQKLVNTTTATASANAESETDLLGVHTKWGQGMAEKCKTSILASRGDPRYNKNYRNNPSLLISHRNQDDDNDDDDDDDKNKELKNVIIDVGKTFREGALRWMPLHGIYHIDGIVLTHEHADAIFGLDDLRGFQHAPAHTTIPVYLSAKCLKTVKKAFGYLVPRSHSAAAAAGTTTNDDNHHVNSNSNNRVKRHVASLKFQTVEWFQPFHVAGLKMTPLPVMHGEDFICNGYAFSVKGDKNGGDSVNVVYLSDISRMIPETEKFILEQLPPTDILVVDTLLHRKEHAVHFSLDQALALVKRLKASRTFLVGMNCDDFPEHDVANGLVRERDGSVEFAHDGLVIEL